MSKLEKSIQLVTEWQKKTFKDANFLSKLHHLKEEVDELIDAIENNDMIDIRMEYADCFMLLFGSAIDYGFSIDDIATYIKSKYEIIKDRVYGDPDENGVQRHIKVGYCGVDKCHHCFYSKDNGNYCSKFGCDMKYVCCTGIKRLK